MGSQFARRSQVHCALRRIGCALPIEWFSLLEVVGRARGAGRSCSPPLPPRTGPPSRVFGSHTRRQRNVGPQADLPLVGIPGLSERVKRLELLAAESSARPSRITTIFSLLALTVLVSGFAVWALKRWATSRRDGNLPTLRGRPYINQSASKSLSNTPPP